MALFKTIVFFRGTTVIFLTTFTDQNGNVIQPPSAGISVAFNTANGLQDYTAAMLPPGSPGGDPVQWYGSWDSRNALPGTTYWSIHANTPLPVVVQDGQFQLNANPANLVSF